MHAVCQSAFCSYYCLLSDCSIICAIVMNFSPLKTIVRVLLFQSVIQLEFSTFTDVKCDPSSDLTRHMGMSPANRTQISTSYSPSSDAGVSR